MAKFLNTQQLSEWIPRIIQEAKEEVVILAPYIQTSDLLYQSLLDADQRGVETLIIYREDKINQIERNKLLSISNLNLMHHPNLHAKCYLNEDFIIITSMNMYEFSEKNNREMGILLINEIHTEDEQWDSDDIEVIEDFITEVRSIINGSSMERASKETHKIGFEFEILKTRKELNEDICLRLNETFIHKRFAVKELNGNYFPFCENIIDRLDLILYENRSALEFKYPEERVKEIFGRFKPFYNEFMIDGYKYYWNGPYQPIYLYPERTHYLWSKIETIEDNHKLYKSAIEELVSFIKGFI